MTERPIPFNAEMVRAILEGRKTQTRRVMKVQPYPDSIVTVEHFNQTVIDRHGDMQPGPEIFGAHWDDGEYGCRCPYGAPGDLFWVRETCWAESTFDGDGVRYAADHAWRNIENTQEASEAWCRLAQYGGDDALDNQTNIGRLVPSIHMPRWASRITLRITDVRVERLQDITEDEARAEGCPYPPEWAGRFMDRDETARTWFKSLWNHINNPGAWDDNPWVWVIAFERVKP